MLGAVIGDIAGSRFERLNFKSKKFELFTPQCRATDDTMMTLAVAKAVSDHRKTGKDLSLAAVECMQSIGRAYPYSGYGGNFFQWIFSDNPQPYNSWGNGAAMRVSACGFAADSLEDAIAMANAATRVTHNHPDGIKGAEATAAAVYLAKTGTPSKKIRDYINTHYYTLNFTLDEIRDEYMFDVSCRGSVPQAIEAFLESTDFEDAVRNAVSIGGDSDTIAAIAGGIAEAYYGIPGNLRECALTYLDAPLQAIVAEFEAMYPVKNISVTR